MTRKSLLAIVTALVVMLAALSSAPTATAVGSDAAKAVPTVKTKSAYAKAVHAVHKNVHVNSVDGGTGDSPPRDERWKPVPKCTGYPTFGSECWALVWQQANGNCNTPTGCIYAGGIYWTLRSYRPAPTPMTSAQRNCLIQGGFVIVGWLTGTGWLAFLLNSAQTTMAVRECAKL